MLIVKSINNVTNKCLGIQEVLFCIYLKCCFIKKLLQISCKVKKRNWKKKKITFKNGQLKAFWKKNRIYLFFLLSVAGTNCTVAQLTAPLLWVFLKYIYQSNQTVHCMVHVHIMQICACSPSGLGYPDPAESEHHPGTWQPSVHSGVLTQHAIQWLSQSH